MGAAIAAVAALALPSSALGFSLTNLSATPGTTQAGANTDVQISLEIADPGDDLRDLTIHLPPGLVGNPLAAPQCTEAQLNARNCPADSDVGDVSNDVTLLVADLLPFDQTVTGDLYNVVPREGEPARFGIILNALPLSLPPPLDAAVLPPIVLQSPAQLRPDDLGLDSVLTDLPRTATVLPGVDANITINGIQLTLAGQAGNPPQGFIRLPTSCKEHTVGFDAVAYENGSTASGETTFTTTGCENVPFSPELSAWVEPQGQSLPADLSTTISQTIEEAGLARAVVTLPQGILGNTNILAAGCPRETFFNATCPPDKIVGNAVAASPLQAQPLTGPVYTVETEPPAIGDLGLDLQGALALKLTGRVTLENFRAVNTFDGLPDIPISDFTLTFTREHGLILTDDLCKASSPPMADAAFTAHSGAVVNTTVPVEVRGCGGGDGKKPRAKVKLRGKENHPKLTFKARAGAEDLRKARFKLPRKLALAGDAKLRAKADGEKLKGKSIRSTNRTLTLKPKQGAGRLRAKAAKGAVEARGKLPKRPKFKVALTDVTGEKTRLTVRAK